MKPSHVVHTCNKALLERLLDNGADPKRECYIELTPLSAAVIYTAFEALDNRLFVS